MQLIHDTYKYNSVDIAFYVVAKANAEKYYINLTKVQKLLYIVYGAYLRIYGKRLCNEHPQAWPYGPVFPQTRLSLLKVHDLSKVSLQAIDKSIIEDKTIGDTIDFVFSEFAKYNAGQLTEWSHQKDSPWYKTIYGEDGMNKNIKWNLQISDKYMNEYFKGWNAMIDNGM